MMWDTNYYLKGNIYTVNTIEVATTSYYKDQLKYSIKLRGIIFVGFRLMSLNLIVCVKRVTDVFYST